MTKFFEKYGLRDITFDILKSYNLTEQEIFKPLFYWMFAIMRNSKSFDITTVFKDSGSANRSISRALVYQGFIHSIIRGKHKDKAGEYHWTQYGGEEKRILRKIAALRQMHDTLTRNMIIGGLEEYYGISYNETDVLDPILTSYFYLQGPAFGMSVDFIHKSFREYFLAEYYLESILNDKRHYLNVGIPSPETISFLDGLLELLLENKNEKLKEHANILLKSLLSQTKQQDITQTLRKNAQRYYEEEQIIFRTKPYESNKIWFIATDFSISKYAELWIHRWLSLYVLNYVAPDMPLDKKTLADFIVKTSRTFPTTRLNKVDLSDQFLAFVFLSGANLSNADLYDAKLSGAKLCGAKLCYADVSYADLSDAKLSLADLSLANLSRADLSYADLSGADLSNASLYDANLYGANLSRADLFNVKTNDGTILPSSINTR